MPKKAFGGIYFDKSDLDMKDLVKKSKKVDLSGISKELGISKMMVLNYLSLGKKDHKVPEEFLEAVNDKYSEYVEKLEKFGK